MILKLLVLLLRFLQWELSLWLQMIHCIHLKKFISHMVNSIQMEQWLFATFPLRPMSSMLLLKFEKKLQRENRKKSSFLTFYRTSSLKFTNARVFSCATGELLSDFVLDSTIPSFCSLAYCPSTNLVYRYFYQTKKVRFFVFLFFPFLFLLIWPGDLQF